MVKTWGSQHSRNGVNVVISLCTTYGRLHLSCHSNWPRHIATNGGRGRSIGPWLLATIMGWSNIFIASSFVYQLIRDFKDFKTLDFQCACFHKEVMIKSQINTYTQNQHQIRTQNQKKSVWNSYILGIQNITMILNVGSRSHFNFGYAYLMTTWCCAHHLDFHPQNVCPSKKKRSEKNLGRCSLFYSSLSLKIKDSNQKEKLVLLLLIGP